MVDMCKAKHEESLQKKRCDGFLASAGAVPPMGHSTALQEKIGENGLKEDVEMLHCYLPDSVDNIWAEFGDPLRAAWIY